jgi:hypothetical protein
LEYFGFGTAFGNIMSTVATDTTISCSLGRNYEQAAGSSAQSIFFDAYDTNLSCSHFVNYGKNCKFQRKVSRRPHIF